MKKLNQIKGILIVMIGIVLFFYGSNLLLSVAYDIELHKMHHNIGDTITINNERAIISEFAPFSTISANYKGSKIHIIHIKDERRNN